MAGTAMHLSPEIADPGGERLPRSDFMPRQS